jgi:zinc/manganese transport system substrate-binding protein
MTVLALPATVVAQVRPGGESQVRPGGESQVRPGGESQVRPGIVASFSVLADMASVIAGNELGVSALVPAAADVHVWQPLPADVRRVGAASVLIQNGLGLEGWMARMPEAAGFKGLLITASADVVPRSLNEAGRRMIDPHAWQDPRNAVLYVRTITAGLVAAFPHLSAALRQRRESFIAEIVETDQWIQQTLANIPRARRRILTSHDAFGYYGARYGVELLAVQGMNTEAEPSAREIAGLVAQIRREKIRAVFVENMTSPRLAQIVAKESGAVLGATVYSDSLSEKTGPAGSYLAMLRHNTTQFAAAMAKN